MVPPIERFARRGDWGGGAGGGAACSEVDRGDGGSGGCIVRRGGEAVE